EERTAFKPFLFVDTGFRRAGQSIAVLALCEGMRRIDFPEQFWRKPLAEQVELAQQRVREHMENCVGELGIWGTIKQYWFYYTPDDCVEISTNGEIVGAAKRPAPGQATLRPSIERLLRGEPRL